MSGEEGRVVVVVVDGKEKARMGEGSYYYRLQRKEGGRMRH